MSIWKKIELSMRERVLILDGAMGTMLQGLKLTEDDFRGQKFAQWPSPVQGNNDLLSITKPEAIRAVHDQFFRVGADFIETNTFNANSISQADYGLQDHADDIAMAAAKIAREIADEWTAKTPEKPRAVLGALGPLSKTLSLSPKVEDPGYRAVSFDEVVEAYRSQALAMFDHIDGFLIETVFDTLNCKAAIYAVKDVFSTKGHEIPLLISGTITDKSGRTLSGQTTEAFWTSIAHAKPFAVGLNCALGAEELRPYVQALSKISDTYVMAYPNAGLPNAFGEYDQDADEMAGLVKEWADEGFVNILGGCCGSTPEHIQMIADAVEGMAPRNPPKIEPALRLSGLEPFALTG
ncbi:MAG: homocysteine S-methyltransferase family protein [Robiginitomaculum sp.]|nr:homocysteine S-methyltransferase family protein [Robiginitomaculum sp.]